MGKGTLVTRVHSGNGMGWGQALLRGAAREHQGLPQLWETTRRPSLAERWEKGWAFKQLVITAQTINLEQRVEGAFYQAG